MKIQHETRVVFVHPTQGELLNHLKKALDDERIKIQAPVDGERESLLELLPNADILIGWGSDVGMLEAARKMKLFINPGTGISQHLDHFRDLEASRQIVLANGHGNSYAVAQHTVALLLALTNKVIPYHQRMVSGQGRAGGPSSTYLKNKTVGFLGYGAINTKVHHFLRGFDLRFSACRKHWEDCDLSESELRRFSSEEVGEFFEHADVVINALPTTAETKECVSIEELRQLGPDGLFINVGRAATVNQSDLYRALNEKIIAGAAIEVWWGRVPPEERNDKSRNDPFQKPFHQLDNVVMSPHRAADSGGDMGRWDEVIENILRLHQGRRDFLNVVDLVAEY